MTPEPLPAPAPSAMPELDHFWASARAGVLLLRRCRDCGLAIWYPRPLCPDCGSDNTEWERASGRGVVYARTVIRRGIGAYAGCGPYVLAYVELDEGPRVMSNVVGCAPVEVSIGLRVEAVFDGAGDSFALIRFRPAAST